MLVFTTLECTTAVDGLGGPPKCAAGEADGTPVQVLFTGNCEGSYARPGELDTSGLVESITLYAAYHAPEGSWPPGDYAVVFSWKIDAFDHLVGVKVTATDDGIVGITRACNHPPEVLVDLHQLTDVIIDPAVE